MMLLAAGMIGGFGIFGLCLLFLLILIGVLIRSRYERTHLVTEAYEVVTEKLGPSYDGFTMVMLSDLHGNVFGEGQKNLIQAIRDAKPDLILMAGDMVTAREGQTPERRALESLLAGLAGLCPICYGDGNHEQRMAEKEAFDAWLRSFGVLHLQNETVAFPGKEGEGSIAVSGVTLDQKYYKKKGKPLPLEEGYLEKRLGKVKEGNFQILLAHNPLFFDAYGSWGADLTFSGHFHGGTIRLPKLGGVMTPQYQFFFPYTRGLYRKKTQKGQALLAVGAGLGTHTINIRLGNPAELLVVRLKTKAV